MQTENYHGIDNRDLRLINLADWNMPQRRGAISPRIKLILDRLACLGPGEAVMTEPIERKEIYLLRSAVYRLIRRYDLDVKVVMRAGCLYFKKEILSEHNQ